MTQEEKKFTDMTETPVPKLILRLAVPTTISMLITTIYNTADTFFVSKISVSASGATGIVFSLMAIFQAFGFMFGHGAGSNISRLLGAKRYDHAGEFLTTSFLLAAAVGALIGAAGLIFLEPLMRLLGSTDTILPEAEAYGRYILIAGPAMTLSCVLNNVLRYEGIAVYAMIGLTSGGILNMILDPIFIFVLGMGTGGAGLATALSQYISLFILLLPFLRGKTTTRIAFRKFRLSGAVVSNICLTGLPSLLRQGMNTVSTAILNIQASAYGDAAIAAFSIVSRVSGLLFSLALGLGQGFQPVSAFNYGAGKFRRVRKAFLFTISSGVAILAVFCAVCGVGAGRIVMLFRDDEAVVSVGARALRFACCGLVFLPFSAIGSMLFQSTGNKRNAIILSTLQSGAVYIPMLLILPALLGLTGLELAQPTAYFIAAVIALPVLLSFLKDLNGREASL